MKQPNILFIMTDQQARHMMSCAGNAWLDTPVMDRLARDGIRFEKAYCTNPVCVPSRISMATGMMSCRLGADNNDVVSGVHGLPPEVDAHSMGKVMKRAGYDTFHGGKVHMCRSLQPADAGYDVVVDDERELLPAACVDFMRQRRQRPFFAVASFINPHDICFAHSAKRGVNIHDVLGLRAQALALPEDQLPILPDNDAIQRAEPAAIEANLNPEAPTPAITMRAEYDAREWRINRWIYHRLTEQVDALVGELLDGVKEAGLDQETLIVFTSDHGNMDASHRLASKGLPYEESVGVPLIMKHPNRIPAGQADSAHLISTGLDILPTLCDYAGVDKPGHLLGRSLRPLAEGRPVEEWAPYVVSENNWFRMLRTPRYKYCCFASEDSDELLVDMETDPGELKNVVDDPAYADVLELHRRQMAEWMDMSDDNEKGKFL